MQTYQRTDSRETAGRRRPWSGKSSRPAGCRTGPLSTAGCSAAWTGTDCWRQSWSGTALCSVISRWLFNHCWGLVHYSLTRPCDTEAKIKTESALGLTASLARLQDQTPYVQQNQYYGLQKHFKLASRYFAPRNLHAALMETYKGL